jgi:hypothetical protein
LASTILFITRRAKSAFSFKIFFKKLLNIILSIKFINNEVNLDVLYTIYCNLGQFTLFLFYNPRTAPGYNKSFTIRQMQLHSLTRLKKKFMAFSYNIDLWTN